MNYPLTTVSGFIEQIGLRLTVQKTETVLFTTRRQFRKPSFQPCTVKVDVQQHIITCASGSTGSCPSVNTQKTNQVYGQAPPNVGGSQEKKRKLLAKWPSMSVALYSILKWVSVTATAYKRVQMELVQRKTELRCISRYRTISALAVNILVGTARQKSTSP